MDMIIIRKIRLYETINSLKLIYMANKIMKLSIYRKKHNKNPPPQPINKYVCEIESIRWFNCFGVKCAWRSVFRPRNRPSHCRIRAVAHLDGVERRDTQMQIGFVHSKKKKSFDAFTLLVIYTNDL